MSQEYRFSPSGFAVVIRTIFIKLFIGLIFAGLSNQALAGTDSRVDILNAEDLALLDGGAWVLASSMRGGLQSQGGIYAIEVHSGRKQPIYPRGGDTGSTPDCPAPVPAEAFAPHGIALHKAANGDTHLYVVNHGDRESIEIFAVEQVDTPGLRWLGCIPVPAGAYGNAVAVAANGRVFMTNMGTPIDGSAAPSPLGGDVLSWTTAGGWRTVPDSAIIGPNGLLVSPDGQELYVASWPEAELIKLGLAEEGTTRAVVALPMLPDNLRWRDNGNILATGHRASVATVTQCFRSEGHCNHRIPSAVAEIDPRSLEVLCDEEIGQSMATVAIDVGAEQWLGTARGQTILRRTGGGQACEQFPQGG